MSKETPLNISTMFKNIHLNAAYTVARLYIPPITRGCLKDGGKEKSTRHTCESKTFSLEVQGLFVRFSLIAVTCVMQTC